MPCLSANTPQNHNAPEIFCVYYVKITLGNVKMQRLKATMFDNSVQVLNCDTKISASPNAGWCDGVISTAQQLPVVEVADCQFTSQ